MKAANARGASWGAVAIATLLMAGIAIFIGFHIDSAIENATQLARPHEVQTALERSKSTLDALQDSVQDYLIDGADGMRYQYEDAARLLGSQVTALQALADRAISPTDLAEIDRDIAEVMTTSRAVIDARNTEPKEMIRRLADVGLLAVNRAQRKLDFVIAAQQESLRARERALRWNVAQMYGGLFVTAIIVVCVLAGAAILLEYDRRRGIAVQEFLRSENERLEEAVCERSATLAQANRELTWFSKRALEIQEQERRNLALELHDQVGQELAALVVTLTRCERDMAPTGQSEVRSAVQASIDIARAAYGDVHNLALDLRPAMLDRLGLIPTLQWYARQQAKHARCEITVEADAFPVKLPSDLLIAAFRIVQEAVSNAVRHANARRIQIEARYRSGCIELRILDDGVGFDPSANVTPQQPGGLGLIGMRQRAQDVGGHVSIRSQPGSGTEVVALLSIPESA